MAYDTPDLGHGLIEPFRDEGLEFFSHEGAIVQKVPLDAVPVIFQVMTLRRLFDKAGDLLQFFSL